MNGTLWAIAGAVVILAGVVSYFVTRRYGWGAAVILPVVALAAMIGMTWQDSGLDLAGGIDLMRESLVFAAPVFGGVLVGILVARRRA
ncbi:hypothetical protein [Rhodobacter sp. SY28-1]|uniref:hypothetical protein n=1 Tax=Rhodobacter sp. SY28-1 TaxID=2562317 RepID=UPI0010C15730|nr:hypothetical protein [Rhodobacter sp. SY28-1]